MKYMLTLIGEEGGWEDASPEEMKAEMDRWQAYGQSLRRRRRVSSPARACSRARPRPRSGSRDGERLVTDGPFAETKEQLGGFYLIEAADLDAALEWAEKIPLLGWRRSRSAR